MLVGILQVLLQSHGNRRCFRRTGLDLYRHTALDHRLLGRSAEHADAPVFLPEIRELIEHQDGWFAFAFVENVPFSNNQAERDIRCLKTKQKVATNFQTFKGAQHYARIQSFDATLRKHSMNVFQNLINVFDRKSIVFQAA